MTPRMYAMTKRRGGRRKTRPRGRAFTLLEVMLAVVIIGLGVLGISALFAGAASQQADSARVNQAVAALRRAESSLVASFGPIRQGYVAGLNSFNPFQYHVVPGVGLHVPPRESVWYPLSAYPSRATEGHPSHALASDPARDPTTTAPQAFFAKRGVTEFVLFENPWNPNLNLPGPLYGTVSFGTAASPDPAETFDVNPNPPPAPNTSPFWDGPTPRIRDLPDRAIHPGSLRIRFEIARAEGVNTPDARVVSRRTVLFSDEPFYTDEGEFDYPDDRVPPVGVLASDGALEVVFFRALTRGPQLSPVARIQSFRAFPGPPARPVLADFANGAGEWIERIVVERYERRDPVLLSLDQRVFRNPDGQSYTGVATLMQRGRSGGYRLGMFAYTAEPAGRGRTFIPPESGNDLDERLLARVEGRLGFDPDSRRYYFEPDDARRQAFAAAAGQVLLVIGDPANPDPAANGLPGADDVSRVVASQERASGSGNSVRAFLDGCPRSGGVPLLDPDTPTQVRQVAVWALRPVVRSLSVAPDPPNALWNIRPVDGRVIEVR